MRRREVSVICLSLLMSGCVAAPKTPVRPPFGGAFTYYKAPLTTDFTNAKGEPTRTDFQKYGVAESHYLSIPIHPIFPILRFGWGDGNLEAAARNGGISEIYYADYETLSILGVYTNFRVYAYGE